MITKEFFGKTIKGEDVFCFKISNSKKEYVKILNYGGIIQSLVVKNKNNDFIDVVLGYDTVKDYEDHDKYMGAVVGRVANRIAKGKFTLNNKEYSLYINNGENHLHGGKEGFDRRVFDYELKDENTVILYLTSPDGDENYPGELKLTVTYTFDDNGIKIVYDAISSDDTPINITNHSYFNLSGYKAGSMVDTKLKLYCDYYTPNDINSIPTGEILPVNNTPMDFREFKAIGKDIDADFDQTKFGKGYDTNWVIKGNYGELRLFAEAIDEKSGILMKAYTTQPGVQFYTGNYIDDVVKGKDNTPFNERDGFCLETQNFPDAVNKENFPSGILKKGEKYHQETVYTFETI
ncbi:hypothetical protein B5E58_05495 [Tyzzerella sp. An114]|uniref:aldose epimerase family protein n=1 Tax=Tyzzerella sp. An114 TaxID=1965545 RepID=UPI000B4321A2|nr:aldose epimerase family protein [Tyzzerella sp. An114]OUQ59229.1 hypothetical protein B5E58_05495 [Tyzzerella sp. An114]HIT73694.1 galactose mutarotase [Candidatus Fimicola cottocaccae]